MLLTVWSYVVSIAGSAWRWVRQSGNWKIVAIALTAIFVAYSIHNYRANKAALAIAEADRDVAKGQVVLLDKARVNDAAAVSSADTAKVAIALKEAEDRVQTDVALKANPAWANEPIPVDVVRSLSD